MTLLLDSGAPAGWGRRLTQLLRTGQAFHIIALRLVGAGLGLLAQVFAAQVIGPHEFGRFALVFVWLLLLGHVGTAGTSQLLYRRLADYIETGRPQLAAGLVRFGLAVTLAASTGIALVGLAVLQLGMVQLEGPLAGLAMLMLLAVPMLALQDFLEAIARGLDRPALGIGPAFLLRHLAIIVGLGGLTLLGQAATAETVLALAMAGLLASVAIQYGLLRPHLRAVIGRERPRFLPREWTHTALPLAAVDLSEVLFLNADILILGLLLPPEQVAFYFAASRLAQLLAYVPYGVSAATAQKFAAHGAAGRRAALQQSISRAALASFVATAVGAVLLTLMAGPLLTLFGSGFDVAQPLVPVLCLGIVVACLLGPGEDVLNMLGEERLCSLAFMVALAGNVVAALLLVPVWGPLGAAVATVIGLFIRGLLLAGFAYRRLGLVIVVFGARALPAKDVTA